MNAPVFPAAAAPPRQRVRLRIRGAVQGVGFRPSVYRQAREFGLAGFVANTPDGLVIEAEGPAEAIGGFVRTVLDAPPEHARVRDVLTEFLPPTGETAFTVRGSLTDGAATAQVLPDLATCAACLAELFDLHDRRHRYPFINCTHCGPRYSIVEDLPYDRARTSMRHFPMCADCQAEYENPADRRFHAEPNACPVCGPKLTLWDAGGVAIAETDAALSAAAAAIREGRIVAVKGLGGFHLMVDARNEAAVSRLRQRKSREEKPFAVMFPSLDAIEAECALGPEEGALLASRERPIVLIRRRATNTAMILPREAGEGDRAQRGGGGASKGATVTRPLHQPRSLRDGEGSRLSPSVAPGCPLVGAMLPYTPLHHLLLADLGFPVVATSGNRSDEPIVTDEREALRRLAGIADLFLVHDRPIVRPVEDSVARILAGRPMLLRRARGYAPAPAVERAMPEGILALGGHLKSTVALSTPAGVILAPHIGDLDTAEARDAYGRARAEIARLHATRPLLAVRDLHPDYHSSRVAEASGLPVVAVQHHLAHIAAAMGEHGLAPPVLGVAFDGTGYGTDGAVWGSEFLLVTEDGWRRVAHLRPFRLPGGEAAVREPRRSALGLLFAAFGRDGLAMTDLAPVVAFTPTERETLAAMLERGVNAPVTTSAGRLFDAVAALLNLRQRATYEGQAAAELEWAAGDGEGPRPPHYARSPLPVPGRDHALPVRSSNRVPVGLGPSIETALPDVKAERRPRAQSLPGTGRGDHATPGLDPGDGGRGPSPEAYSLPVFAVDGDSPFIVDWRPALDAILADLRAGRLAGDIARAFHLGLAEAIADVAGRFGEATVVLTGGCFQNALLTEAAVAALRRAGRTPYWPQAVPPNDGGLALGQAMWAAWLVAKGEAACA